MHGYKVWTDTRTNRLHLLIKRSLSQTEIQTAKWMVRQASESLQPNYSITIQHDLQETNPEAQNSDPVSIIRIKKDLKHILCALQESAA